MKNRYSEVDTVDKALQFLMLDAEIMACEDDSLLNTYDKLRLRNIAFLVDYVRRLEESNEELRKVQWK